MNTRIILGTVAAAAVLLAGCGGGGGSTPAPTPVAVQISGTAATGAPFGGAAVTIIDKTGAQVGTGTTNADGSYTITLSTSASAPFVIQAVRDDLTLVSVAPDTTTTNINITPITNLIAARLSASGDPAKLAAELKANPNLVTSATVNAKVDEIVAVLKPLLDAVGTNVNPLTGKFAADGTGADRALDALSIRITPTTSGSNIEVAVKLASDDQPALVQFNSTASTVAALPAIDKTKLIESGTAPLIAALLERVTACHNLPTTERVSNANTSSATAADIKASACKSLFMDDNPGLYKNNGRVVGGNSSTNDWFGIFHDGATGAKFDRGVYDFSRANGDLVISFRVTTADGNTQERSLVATKATVDGKPQLRITGNGYLYAGEVTAYQQLRTFLNKPEADYYSTGYTLGVPNNGQFAKVDVVSPKGNTITLHPIGASAFMSITPGTSFLRLGRQFANGSASDPKLMDTSLAFSAAAWTDAELAAIPQQGVWTFKYFLVGNATGTPDAIQTYKTRARAMTIAEFKTQPLAKLTDADIAQIKSETVSTDFIDLGADKSPTIGLNWNVPTGALAPINLMGFGRQFIPGTPPTFVPWDDSINVASTARTGHIPCVKQNNSDPHCVMSGSGLIYAPGANLNSVHLRARDPYGRDFTQFYAFYRPVMP